MRVRKIRSVRVAGEGEPRRVAAPDAPDARQELDTLFSVTYEELRRLASAVKP